MAILQLSRITNRKGLSENLPQLAGAEFGWSLDDRRLYIGNGTVVDGAPVVGNTEILTEFSDILALSASYTYQGSAAGYVVTTGDNGNEIVRSLQSKFDDMASVKDFGAIGDGVADDTDAINRALFELFCRELNPQIRRSLFFPAGTYNVRGKIKIPPHAKLYGEGLTSSIINFVREDDIPALDMVNGSRYTISAIGDTNWTSIGAGAALVNEIFVYNGVAVTGTTGIARPRATDDAVVETSDSLHQTGLNIGTNDATAPTGIEMASMAVYSDEVITLLKLDSCSNSGFHYLGLHGPRADLDSAANATSAIEIATSVSPTQDVTISKLDTQGTTYGLRVEGQARGIVLENSGINLHFQGVLVTNELIDVANIVTGQEYKIMSLGTGTITDFTSLGATYNRVGITFIANAGALLGTGKVISMAVEDRGPTGVVISRNIFDNITHEGIDFNNVLFNSSGYNVFYGVGNGDGLNVAYPVIRIASDQCVSVGDLFEREDETTAPRISLEGNGGISIDSTHSIHLGSYERQIGIESGLTAGVVSEEIFEFAHTASNSYRVDYNVKRDDVTRMGRIYVSNDAPVIAGIVDPDGPVGPIEFSEEFTESGDTGIVFDVVNIKKEPDPIGAALVYTYTTSALRFTSTVGNDAVLNFSVVRLD